MQPRGCWKISEDIEHIRPVTNAASADKLPCIEDFGKKSSYVWSKIKNPPKHPIYKSAQLESVKRYQWRKIKYTKSPNNRVQESNNVHNKGKLLHIGKSQSRDYTCL